MHLSSLIRFALLVCFCCSPLLLSVLLSPRLTLVWRNNCLVGAVLLPFVCPVLLCVRCPVGFVSSCCFWLRGLAVPFLVRVLLALLVRASVIPCCLLSLVVLPVSVPLASPAPREVSFVLWSSLHSCVLVPPSEYLVAAVTALLPCFHAGSVV